MKQRHIQPFLQNERELEFTPLEFETRALGSGKSASKRLEFTPLEFETVYGGSIYDSPFALEFTPLEFETPKDRRLLGLCLIRIYSVGV